MMNRIHKHIHLILLAIYAVLAVALLVCVLLPVPISDARINGSSDNTTEPWVQPKYKKGTFPEPIRGLQPLTMGGESGCSTNMTFYPEAHPEAVSVDGNVEYSTYPGVTWATIHDAGTGSGSADDGDHGSVAGLYAGTTLDKWKWMVRSVFVVDTSALPDTAIITGAYFKLYGESSSRVGDWNPSFNIYSFNPISDNAVAVGDYEHARYGLSAYSDTSILYGDWNTGDPGDANEWEFNEVGLGAISKNGTTKLSLRSLWDANDSAPAWGDGYTIGVTSYMADKGVGYKPELVVCYYLSVPDCPASLTLEDLGGSMVAFSWPESGNATGYLLRYKRNDYPESVSDGELAYFGNATSGNISGLALELTRYDWSLWAYGPGGYSECYRNNSIGGEAVVDSVMLVLPLAAALVLMLISFFIKSVIIKIAIICLMWAVFIEPQFKDTWVQSAAILIIIWAGLSAFFRAKEKGAL